MKSLALLFLAALSLHAWAAEERTSFMASVRESVENRYKAAEKQSNKLMAEGHLDEANAAYLSAIPEDEMTPADCFVLGTVFLRTAPELSAKFHERAFKALPDDPRVNLEWGKILHRQGKHHEAAACYRSCLKALDHLCQPHALLADCLVRIGELPEALAHWERAGHSSNRIDIEFAIHGIHGETWPFYRHDLLLKAVKGGAVERLDELFALAASQDNYMWDIVVNSSDEILERDLLLAKTLLGENDPRFKELELYSATYLNEPDKEWLQAELVAHQFILGAEGKLPESGYVADRLIQQTLEHGLLTEPELLKQFEAELRTRAQSTTSRGAMALNTLATLVYGTDDSEGKKLEEINAMGWHQHHDERFAAALLVGKESRNELSFSSPLLKRAMTEFPESPRICALNLRLATQEKAPLREPLACAIKAEFRHLTGLGGSENSHHLNSLFALLRQELGGK